MTKWTGKSRGNALGYKIFIFLIEKVGVVPSYIVLRVVAFYFFLFSPNASRAIRKYFVGIHQYSTWKAIASVYANYYVFGQIILDKFIVLAGKENFFTCSFHGEENINDIIEHGRGGLLVSAHMGNWEMAGHLFKRLEGKINIVMLDEEHAKIKKLSGKLENKSFHVIPIKEDGSHVFEMSQAFSRNEVVCMHGDRFVPGTKSYQSEFMGQMAEFPAGPFDLATRLNIPYSFVYGFKTSNATYELFASEMKIRQKGESRDMLREYILSLEEKVRKYPLQWFNYYNFWMD